MLLFTVIFFAMVIVAGVSAVAAFSFYLKRRAKHLQANNPPQFTNEPPPFRSLFAPTDEEIRALERAESKESAARAAANARLLAEKRIRAARDFQGVWANEPSVANTVGLLRLAALTENAEVLSETSAAVIKFRRENKIANLTANDLADLLDSHLGTLPQQERTAGATFWLRREIMSLRRAESE